MPNRKILIAIPDPKESFARMGWPDVGFNRQDWEAFLADCAATKPLTYDAARTIARKRFPWYGWPVRVVRRAIVNGVFAWARSRKDRPAFSPAPERGRSRNEEKHDRAMARLADSNEDSYVSRSFLIAPPAPRR